MSKKVEISKIDVFSDLNKFNGLLRPFEYRSFNSALRGFIDAYGPSEHPEIDAFYYSEVDKSDTQSYLKELREREGYDCKPAHGFNRGLDMLGTVLSDRYGATTTVSLNVYMPKGGDIRNGEDIAYVMQISVPTLHLREVIVARYEKNHFPSYIYDELIPSILDRSINEPCYLLSSKAFEKGARLNNYSADYVFGKIIEEAHARGWYRVDRHGHQLLFVAKLKIGL